MVDIASRRLSPFAPRARVLISEGDVRLPFPGGWFDRFVSTYVLDLLPEADIALLLNEAHRVLTPEGRLCLAALTHGRTLPSRVLSRTWAALQSVRPGLVGGCRPIEIEAFLAETRWHTLHREVVTAWAVPSEVLVAEAR